MSPREKVTPSWEPCSGRAWEGITTRLFCEDLVCVRPFVFSDACDCLTASSLLTPYGRQTVVLQRYSVACVRSPVPFLNPVHLSLSSVPSAAVAPRSESEQSSAVPLPPALSTSDLLPAWWVCFSAVPSFSVCGESVLTGSLPGVPSSLLPFLS